LAHTVGGVERWINSMVGTADPEWIDEWRSHWNRLEYVHASMIDDGRGRFIDDEEQLIADALDALEALAQR
jgi:hypothetical protein